MLLTSGDIPQPVRLAKAIHRLGPDLNVAHKALCRLAEGKSVVVELDIADPDSLAELTALGGIASVLKAPDPDIKQIRDKLGLSQSEFAMRFGLELDTLRNWEQGRDEPGPAARVLLKVIELHPSAVTDALRAG